MLTKTITNDTLIAIIKLFKSQREVNKKTFENIDQVQKDEDKILEVLGNVVQIVTEILPDMIDGLDKRLKVLENKK